MVGFNQNVSLAQEKVLDLIKRYGTERIVAPSSTPQEEQEANEDKKPKEEELRHLAQKYNHEMKRLNTNITFNYNDTIEGLVVVVKEGNTEKVIREIPYKEAIELTKKMRELVGTIFDKES